MAVVIPILKRTEFNASFLGASGTQTVVLGTVNVVPYYYATLVVRLHDATWSGGAATTFKVEGFASYPTPEDSRSFVTSSAGISATFTQGTTVPGFAVGTASNLPVAYQFMVTLTQTTGGAAFFVVASADLLLRES